MGGSPGDVGEVPVTYVMRQKCWRMNCDVGEAMKALENELWRRWSDGKGWKMSCDVGEPTERFENELWRKWSDGKVWKWAVT